ncbi:hypothetical protein [Hahella sp. NBU794]|uniref:hypothetical protein n=1 Tax=Hahella sp. NBU794 TaxID=3422590 RepID=UPI003D6E60A3
MNMKALGAILFLISVKSLASPCNLDGVEAWAASFPKAVIESHNNSPTRGVGDVTYKYLFPEYECGRGDDSPLDLVFITIDELDESLFELLSRLIEELPIDAVVTEINHANTELNIARIGYYQFLEKVKDYQAQGCLDMPQTELACTAQRRHAKQIITHSLNKFRAGLDGFNPQIGKLRSIRNSGVGFEAKQGLSSLLRQIIQLTSIQNTLLSRAVVEFNDAADKLGGLIDGVRQPSQEIADAASDAWSIYLGDEGQVHNYFITAYEEMRNQLVESEPENVKLKQWLDSSGNTHCTLKDGNLDIYLIEESDCEVDVAQDIRLLRQRELYFNQLYIRSTVLPYARKVSDDTGNELSNLDLKAWFYRIYNNSPEYFGRQEIDGGDGLHGVIFYRELFDPLNYRAHYQGRDQALAKYQDERFYINYIKRRENLFRRFEKYPNIQGYDSYLTPTKRIGSWSPDPSRFLNHGLWREYYNNEDKISLLSQQREIWESNDDNQGLLLNGYFVEPGFVTFKYRLENAQSLSSKVTVYIDGLSVLEDTGESGGWSQFNGYLSKGFHTLEVYHSNADSVVLVADVVHPPLRPVRWSQTDEAPIPSDIEQEGDWHGVLCPYGAYASGVQVSLGPSKSNNWEDERGIEAMRLYCTDKNGNRSVIVKIKDESVFTDWGLKSACPPGEHFMDVKARRNSVHDGGDETGVNAIEFTCSGGRKVAPDNVLHMGEWSDPLSSDKRAICGVKGKIQSFQGRDRDDTGLNSLEFVFCGYEEETESDREAEALFADYVDVEDKRLRIFDIGHPASANPDADINPGVACVTVGDKFPEIFHGDYVFTHTFYGGRPEYRRTDGGYMLRYWSSAWRLWKPRWVPEDNNRLSYYWQTWWGSSAYTPEESSSYISPCL